MPKVAVKQVVSNSLVELKKICDDWQSACNESEALISAIANSLQQVKCCKKAKLENTTLLHKYSDIKEALIVKLSINANTAFQKLEKIVIKLHKHLNDVRNITEKLHKAITSVLLQEDAYLWTATEPSNVDVVLWITTSHFIMNESFAEKLDILEQLSFIFAKLDENIDCEHVKKLKSLWNNNDKFLNAKNEIFSYCSNFIPSKSG